MESNAMEKSRNYNIYLATFNVMILKRKGQFPEQTMSTAERDIDIVCIQENWYYHSEQEIR